MKQLTLNVLLTKFEIYLKSYIYNYCIYFINIS